MGLAINQDDYVCVTDWTTSNDFPTTGDAYHLSVNGNKDGFILKLSANIMKTIIAIEGRDRDEFTISPECSAAIIPRGAGCIFRIKIEPLLDTGSLVNLFILFNDSVRNPLIVPIKGLGISGSLI